MPLKARFDWANELAVHAFQQLTVWTVVDGITLFGKASSLNGGYRMVLRFENIWRAKIILVSIHRPTDALGV